MSTKAQLEAELVALRAEMAEMQADRAQRAEPSENDGLEQPTETAEVADGDDGAADMARDDLEQGLRDIASEIQAVAERNPAIALIGVFVAGLILGRLMAR